MDSAAPSKRPRTPAADALPELGSSRDRPIVLESLLRSVSPPRKRPRQPGEETAAPVGGPLPLPLRSPFQLTAVRDLPASANVDTLTVRDVFGSPRLRACWEFNFLHDLDFLMGAFDADAVQRGGGGGIDVHVVHGFWKSEDPRRRALEQDAARINARLRLRRCSEEPTTITLHTADLPEPFGTHHTKMAVLFHDDDTAQIVIHTANMIPHDWTNMTQAVWRSPLLPLLPRKTAEDSTAAASADKKTQLGVGDRFKKDFLNYLRAYNRRRPVCQPLIQQLVRYDFSGVQAVLIGSVPGRHAVPPPGQMNAVDGETGATTTTTQWGWAGMSRALQQVPIRVQASPQATSAGEIVIQVSSIATLGGHDAWLRQTLFKALSGGQTAPGTIAEPQPIKTALSFNSLRGPPPPLPKPQFRVVFPVADEIRRSLDGYASGTSIHTKIQSPQQQRQLEYMRPLLCHWANDAPDGEPLSDSSAVPHRDAGRNRAAPHIKTYIRYAPDGSIDWALLTSANLSKQAWGEATSMRHEMRIASYELGVLVWPALLVSAGSGGGSGGVGGVATMQPVFARDTFAHTPGPAESVESVESSVAPVVPLRMPYSLPLQRYGKTETPWVVTLPHATPDWRGVSWTDV